MNQVRGLGRAIFAGVLLAVGGILNVIYGIAAISNSNFFAHNAHYAFANLKTWGWVTLLLGVLELLASMSLFGGGAFGRYFGIAVAGLAAIGALLSLPAYPLWAVAVFGLSLWIIHGLAIYGQPEEMGPSSEMEMPSTRQPMSTAPRPPM